jgi:hypothetical protein
MKRSLCSLLSYVFFIACVFSYGTIQGHGFSRDTWLRNCDKTWAASFESVCVHVANKQKRCVASYDITTQKVVEHARVCKSGRSTVPWYISISCIPNFTACNWHDIACSPLQEFYNLGTGAWVCAQEIEVGDTLLGHDGPQVVTYVEWINQELEVYTLEVEDPRTFFVGHGSLLTHNIDLTGTLVNISSCALGAGGVLSAVGTAALGTTSVIAPYATPIIFTVGLVVSGLAGEIIKCFWDNTVPAYKAVTNGFGSFFAAKGPSLSNLDF